MARDRWNDGKPETGIDFHPGFVSPWNGSVREFSEFARIQTNPAGSRPSNFESEMDGDANTNWGTGGKKGR